MADLKDLMKADAGAGFEGMDGQDFGAPFLMICQSQSPQLQSDNQQYIEEARPGMIMNTQTQHVFKEITVIPVRYTFRYVEWKQRTAGGGFVASYARTQEPHDITTDALTGKLSRANGNSIVQTSYHLVMVKEENWDKAIIPMSSTQLKKARRWNTVMLGYHMDGGEAAPIFSHYFKLTTVRESNSMGAWYGWKIDPAGEIDDLDLYTTARAAFQTQVNFLPERLIAQVNGGNGDKDVL